MVMDPFMCFSLRLLNLDLKWSMLTSIGLGMAPLVLRLLAATYQHHLCAGFDHWRKVTGDRCRRSGFRGELLFGY